MELFQIDDDGRLFIAPDIDDWSAAAACCIDVVIDLEGGIDGCIPTKPNDCLYIYYPIDDDDQALPDMAKLHAIAKLAASLIADGHRVVSHCRMGYNRSAFVAGLILMELGMSGSKAIERLRERRPGALFNDYFAAYLSARQG